MRAKNPFRVSRAFGMMTTNNGDDDRGILGREVNKPIIRI